MDCKFICWKYIGCCYEKLFVADFSVSFPQAVLKTPKKYRLIECHSPNPSKLGPTPCLPSTLWDRRSFSLADPAMWVNDAN